MIEPTGLKAVPAVDAEHDVTDGSDPVQITDTERQGGFADWGQ
jgi:hypothetical protein